MKVPEYVYGCIAPVFTAFKDDESFDEVGQRNLLDFMIDNGGVSAYFMRSGMGQMRVYEYEDVRAAAETVCDHMAGKGPVLMNCSGIWDGNREAPERPDPEVYSTQAVELSQYAESVGAAGVVHVVPDGLLPRDGEKDIESTYLAYFERVCGSVGVPVFIYQPPMPQDVCLTPELLTKLADIPNLVGVKVSTKDGYWIYELIRAVRGKDFHVITGAEMLFYATLHVGSRAVIGQGCNLCPQILNAILHRFEKGDYAGMLEAQDSANLLFRRCPYSPGVMKRLATENGYPVGPTARNMGKSVYGRRGMQFNDETYRAFKELRARELAKYM